ncbi:hypothetical protein ACIOWI_28775 [Streptomyces sp. NPDC087659]|uniref:hypothetical protein n=1 Tax=unclassified Streptomyces TaxID=2593676 RepID=UPI0036BB110B
MGRGVERTVAKGDDAREATTRDGPTASRRARRVRAPVGRVLSRPGGFAFAHSDLTEHD